MQIRTFTVPIHDDGAGMEKLNRFLCALCVLEVEREFVVAGRNNVGPYPVPLMVPALFFEPGASHPSLTAGNVYGLR